MLKIKRGHDEISEPLTSLFPRCKKQIIEYVVENNLEGERGFGLVCKCLEKEANSGIFEVLSKRMGRDQVNDFLIT